MNAQPYNESDNLVELLTVDHRPHYENSKLDLEVMNG